MGYTHYWRQSQDFTGEQWKKLLFVARNMSQFHLAGWDGTGLPSYTGERISFNGTCDHETFILTRAAENFSFCKTARKPYDINVCIVLQAARIVAPNSIRVSTDADSFDCDNWPNALTIAELLLSEYDNG